MSSEQIFKKNIIDVVKYRWVWFALSFLLIIPGVVAMIYSSFVYPNHTPLNVGIDFTGGTIYQYETANNVTNEDLALIRENLTKQGVENPVIQVLSNINPNVDKDKISSNIVSIRTAFSAEKGDTTGDKVTEVLKNKYEDVEFIQANSIGPTLGKELFKKSLLALSLAFLGIVAYLTIRFQLDFAIISLLALVHDTIFLLGVFSILGLLFGIQIDSLFITAILTVIGFSVHDTIVVFDRIRENLIFLKKKHDFNEVVNASVNQTLARSINTSVTTLITLLALYFFGGVTTKNFVLVMILGITIGTYSSIFFASTILAWWREKKTSKKNNNAKK